MGFFDTLSDLLDENSPNSLDKKLTGAIDGVEQALGGALETAENGIKKVDDAVTRLQESTEQAVSKGDAAVGRLDKLMPGDKN